MNVQEFVEETLRQIVTGVKFAQNHVGEQAQIAPEGHTLESVEFDIAVVVEEGKAKEKGAGLFVYVFKAGASGQTSALTSTTHRIKFSVKIDFESKRIHKSEYDKIIDDPDKYIKSILKIRR